MTTGLLLLHAFPLDARMWAPRGDAAAIVAPDLPGFGTAPMPEGGVLTMERAARAALEALDEAGMSRAVVCGLSMGGYVAFELWRTARQRVAGLVLANTRAEPDTDEAREGRRRLAARLREEGNVLAEDPPPLLSEHASPELRERVWAIIASQSPQAIAAAALGMAERPDSRPDLPTIDVPTLVITSDGDRLIPPEVSSPIAEAVPAAELAVIRGAGHLSNLERPDEFDALVRDFRERHGL